MTVEQAIEQLRMTIQSYKEKRKRTLSDLDIQAIMMLLQEVHRKDRL